MSKFSKYLNVAISFGISGALAVYLGHLGGSWVDGRLGTEPWFQFFGILLGIGTAFKMLITDTLQLEKEERRRGKNGDDEPE